MILDSSAVVALLLRQAEHPRLVDRLTSATAVGIGTPTAVESGIVLTSRLGIQGKTLLLRFLQEGGIRVVSFGEEHWTLALEAFRRYGKGRHPAALNLGDCMTYAVAKVAGRPLLCVGSDFSRTDLLLVG